jgi:hypothetical protein
MVGRSQIRLRAITLASLLMLMKASICVAEPQRPAKPDFATTKQEMISRLQTELACVEAAKDDADMRACRPKRPQGSPDGRNGTPSGAENSQYNLPDF